MNTLEIYRNHGCLSAEKRNVYTYVAPESTAVVSDKITVKIPDDWDVYETVSGTHILISPWGMEYRPNEVLYGNDKPVFAAYHDGEYYKSELEVIEDD